MAEARQREAAHVRRGARAESVGRRARPSARANDRRRPRRSVPPAPASSAARAGRRRPRLERPEPDAARVCSGPSPPRRVEAEKRRARRSTSRSRRRPSSRGAASGSSLRGPPVATRRPDRDAAAGDRRPAWRRRLCRELAAVAPAAPPAGSRSIRRRWRRRCTRQLAARKKELREGPGCEAAPRASPGIQRRRPAEEPAPPADGGARRRSSSRRPPDRACLRPSSRSFRRGLLPGREPRDLAREISSVPGRASSSPPSCSTHASLYPPIARQQRRCGQGRRARPRRRGRERHRGAPPAGPRVPDRRQRGGRSPRCEMRDFKPATKNGVPVKMWRTVVVDVKP